MARAYVAVGSNVGDRAATIANARRALEARGVRVTKASMLMETAPVGGPPQGDYLNGVWEVETALEPRALLDALLAVETSLGRKRSVKNAPRTIDLDLVLYEDRVIDEAGLAVPHPRMHERAFVLQPLREIAPDLVHPVLKKPLRDL